MPNPTLDTADATALATWNAQFTPTLNGIDCNSCGNELKDLCPGLVAFSSPPQTPVICDGCGFTGYRILLSSVANTIIHTPVSTRAIGSYSCPTTGDGVEMAVLTPDAITCSKAGNYVKIECVLDGEPSGVDVGYLVSRNGVLLPDATDGSDNRWAVIAVAPQDQNFATTPDNMIITMYDFNSLDIPATYRILCRATSGTARTQHVNECVLAGQDSRETMLSTVTLTEIIT